MDNATTQEQVMFIGNNVDSTNIRPNDNHTKLIVTVQGGNIIMKFNPEFYLLALFSFYTQKAAKTKDIYTGIKELIKGKAILLTKLEEMVLQIQGMPYYHNKQQDFSGVVRQLDAIIAVYNIDIQSTLSKNQIDTNTNVQTTNNHIKDNNRFLNIVFKWTLFIAIFSLIVSTISAWVAFKDYNREVQKDTRELQQSKLDSQLQAKNLENDQLKNENASYKKRADSLLEIVHDASR